MKVLVVPKINVSPAWILFVQEILDMLNRNGIETAVSAPKDTYKHTALYPYTPLSSSVLDKFRKINPSGYEEYCYSSGISRQRYLKSDTETVKSVIDAFHPDYVLDLGRFSAIIAARMTNTPYISYVNGAMYRNRSFDPVMIREVNSVLSSSKVEQVFRLNELYNYAHGCFTLGSSTLNLLPESAEVLRIGRTYRKETREENPRNVCVYLYESGIKKNRLKTLLDEAYKGAPYTIEIWYPGSDIGKEENLHYASSIRLSQLDRAQVLIHDGDDYLFHQAVLRGIPQLVITDGSWKRSWYAATVSRNGFGTSLPEEDLSVRTVYESYRRLLANEHYSLNAGKFQKEAQSLPGLDNLLTLFD